MYSVGLMLSMDDYWMHSMAMNSSLNEDKPRYVAPEKQKTTTKPSNNIVDFDEPKTAFSIVA
jgi:hypothetical protein